jgi:alanine dehydrogenase
MTEILTVGLPRMHVEFGERRDFLPAFVADMEKRGAQVFLEYGYGSGMGFTEADYEKVAPIARFVSHEEVYQKQIVLVLRCPSNEDLKLMRPGSCLISMLHYPTRPQRVDFLKALGIEAVSLDSLKDETGRRLIENLRSVAWNGLEVGFQILHRTYPSPGLESHERGPVYATILGVGAVGMHAVQAASRYGDMKLWQTLAERGVPGVQVTAVDYDLTDHEEVMKKILSRTDILVDATQRPDPSKVVIPNEWVGLLPEHAVLVDLSVDPYNCSLDPPEVKGIEGMPQGNLDQYVFMPDDSVYERIPDCVSTKHRRHAVSCYSWPGIHPKSCMTLYGEQIRPIMRTIIDRNGVQNINSHGRYFERAIRRALLSSFESNEPGPSISKPEKEDKG